jgi:hypothetical protein
MATDEAPRFRQRTPIFSVHPPEKERFDFPPEDSGKTGYFCIRDENAGGKPGSWGLVFSEVIP